MEYQYKLRPHHGLCISFFSAKRDSEKYKEHIKKIIVELENTSIVCITLQSDIWIFLSQETQIPVTWKPVFRSGNHH